MNGIVNNDAGGDVSAPRITTQRAPRGAATSAGGAAPGRPLAACPTAGQRGPTEGQRDSGTRSVHKSRWDRRAPPAASPDVG